VISKKNISKDVKSGQLIGHRVVSKSQDKFHCVFVGHALNNALEHRLAETRDMRQIAMAMAYPLEANRVKQSFTVMDI
jgi:hypothetical protein